VVGCILDKQAQKVGKPWFAVIYKVNVHVTRAT